MAQRSIRLFLPSWMLGEPRIGDVLTGFFAAFDSIALTLTKCFPEVPSNGLPIVFQRTKVSVRSIGGCIVFAQSACPVKQPAYTFYSRRS